MSNIKYTMVAGGERAFNQNNRKRYIFTNEKQVEKTCSKVTSFLHSELLAPIVSFLVTKDKLFSLEFMAKKYWILLVIVSKLYQNIVSFISNMS